MFNGWKNYETWNVALWIGNDQGYYELAKECDSYKEFICIVTNNLYLGTTSKKTPDDISWIDESLDYERLDELIKELGNDND